MQGTRLVREILGVAHKKPKGKDELAPEADDPPWPDVKVVVIVNKRSGSRVVRTPSKSNTARIVGGGAEPARDISFFASQPRRNACRKHLFLRGARVSRAVSSDARRKARPLTLPPPPHRTAQGRQLARKLVEVRARPRTRPDRTRRVASRSGDISPAPGNIATQTTSLGCAFATTAFDARFSFFFRSPKLARDARASLLPSSSTHFLRVIDEPSPDFTRRNVA
jgi:hypothetical protein